MHPIENLEDFVRPVTKWHFIVINPKKLKLKVLMWCKRNQSKLENMNRKKPNLAPVTSQASDEFTMSWRLIQYLGVGHIVHGPCAVDQDRRH